MTAPSDQAERFRRARTEFVEAMAAGCTILELRRRRAAQRAALRERAQAEVEGRTADLMDRPIRGRQGFVIVDEFAFFEGAQGDFRAFDAPWMMRD